MFKYLLLLLFTCNLFSADLMWQDSYASAMKKAQKEHKRVMLLITSETCKWCRKLESTTLKDDEVVARLQEKYVMVDVTRHKDSYPKKFQAKVVPMTYFLTNEGEIVMRGVMGYWSSEDYLSIMDDVDRYYKKLSKN